MVWYNKWCTSRGNSLSPALFGLFLKDLLREVKDLKLSIKMTEEIMSILAFADDIVIFTESEND